LTKNSYHHGNLKEAVLNEALSLLNSQNYNQLSFRLISRKLGVVSSAPYNHFKDKKQLIQEIILVGERKLLSEITLEKKKSKLPSEQLPLIAKAYLNFAIKEKALFDLMFGKANKELLHLTDKIVLQFSKIITEKFNKGKRLKLTAKGSAIAAWAMIHGLAITINNSSKDNVERLWNTKLETIFKEMSSIWGKGVNN
jgi:AcrR family transcriptional regulator